MYFVFSMQYPNCLIWKVFLLFIMHPLVYTRNVIVGCHLDWTHLFNLSVFCASSMSSGYNAIAANILEDIVVPLYHKVTKSNFSDAAANLIAKGICESLKRDCFIFYCSAAEIYNKEICQKCHPLPILSSIIWIKNVLSELLHHAPDNFIMKRICECPFESDVLSTICCFSSKPQLVSH